MLNMSNMLVRAQRKEDGAEVVGYFYARVWNGQVFANVQEVEAKDGFFKTHAVYPDTVCRCVGSRDCNNELLFEGDVVSTKYDRKCKIVWKHTDGFIGWDLEPADDCSSPPPSEWDLWYPENLERINNDQ